MKIRPDNKKLQYSGRIDWANVDKPIFVFPCTYVKMRYTGKLLRVYVENKNHCWENYLGCIVDGEQMKLKLPENGSAQFEISTDFSEQTIHEVLIFKRQDACHEMAFLGFEIEDGEQILDLPELPERRIEVYGDSVSAGEVSEAVQYTGKVDPEHNGQYSNSWYSYAWMTARKLGAQIHDIAQGGIALLDRTGWFNAPEYIGMETAWDKVHYNPVLGESTQWDFKEYKPHVVIVALGQNDSHPDDYMKEDYDDIRSCRWRSSYKEFLGKLRTVYPDAWIICITTLLGHDASWDKAIAQVCEEVKDDKIKHFLFKRNGNGTPGHLRITEAEEMADELSAYINTLDVEW